MKVPKYIKKKIIRRAYHQSKANSLQIEIDEYLEKHGIENEYHTTHICLFCEPQMVKCHLLKLFDEQEKEGEQK